MKKLFLMGAFVVGMAGCESLPTTVYAPRREGVVVECKGGEFTFESYLLQLRTASGELVTVSSKCPVSAGSKACAEWGRYDRQWDYVPCEQKRTEQF